MGARTRALQLPTWLCHTQRWPWASMRAVRACAPFRANRRSSIGNPVQPAASSINAEHVCMQAMQDQQAYKSTSQRTVHSRFMHHTFSARARAAGDRAGAGIDGASQQWL